MLQAHSGLYSVKNAGGGHSHLVYADAVFQFGTYEHWARVDNGSGDIGLLFHYQDEDDFYELETNPAGTDTPRILLRKTVNGARTNIAQVAPPMGTHEWFRVTLIREGDGSITVYINGSLTLTAVDAAILEPGHCGFREYSNDCFVDDILVDADVVVAVESETWGAIKNIYRSWFHSVGRVP